MQKSIVFHLPHYEIPQLSSHYYRPNEVVMKMLFPHENEESLEYQKTNVTMRQTPSFPTNGFSLNLALRYDNEFANQFGASAENT